MARNAENVSIWWRHCDLYCPVNTTTSSAIIDDDLTFRQVLGFYVKIIMWKPFNAKMRLDTRHGSSAVHWPIDSMVSYVN